jgi:hypothetical protein
MIWLIATGPRSAASISCCSDQSRHEDGATTSSKTLVSISVVNSIWLAARQAKDRISVREVR